MTLLVLGTSMTLRVKEEDQTNKGRTRHSDYLYEQCRLANDV